MDPLVVEAATAWSAWDAYPASRARERRLTDALGAIAGEHSTTELRVWVNQKVGEGMSRSDAIREWVANREEQQHG